MANDNFGVIPAPVASPPRLGLLASGQRPDLGDVGDLWIAGIKFRPEVSTPTEALDGGGWWDICDMGSELAGVAPGFDKTDGPVNPDTVLYKPVQLVESERCPAVTFRTADYQGRARRRLTATTSWKLEREFATGEMAQAGHLPNDYLENPATCDDLGAYPLVHALSKLQQYLADTIPGRGMIHCTVALANLWTSAYVVRRDGNLLLDVMDNIVVPGTGYTGAGPGGSAPTENYTEWAYATGMVQVLDGPIDVFPDTIDEAIDTASNIVEYTAEKYVAAFHDQQAHAAVYVDLCNTCCTPVS